MREAPYLEVRVAKPLAGCAVAQTGDPVGERRQFHPRGLGHAGHAKAPGDDVRNEVGDLHPGCEVAVHEEGLGDGYPVILNFLRHPESNSLSLAYKIEMSHSHSPVLGI